MRLLPCDDDLSLRGETLQEALDQDRKEGLIPFYVSFDNISLNTGAGGPPVIILCALQFLAKK